jgi:hypothetical protein
MRFRRAADADVTLRMVHQVLRCWVRIVYEHNAAIPEVIPSMTNLDFYLDSVDASLLAVCGGQHWEDVVPPLPGNQLKGVIDPDLIAFLQAQVALPVANAADVALTVMQFALARFPLSVRAHLTYGRIALSFRPDACPDVVRRMDRLVHAMSRANSLGFIEGFQLHQLRTALLEVRRGSSDMNNHLSLRQDLRRALKASRVAARKMKSFWESVQSSDVKSLSLAGLKTAADTYGKALLEAEQAFQPLLRRAHPSILRGYASLVGDVHLDPQLAEQYLTMADELEATKETAVAFSRSETLKARAEARGESVQTGVIGLRILAGVCTVLLCVAAGLTTVLQVQSMRDYEVSLWQLVLAGSCALSVSSLMAGEAKMLLNPLNSGLEWGTGIKLGTSLRMFAHTADLEALQAIISSYTPLTVVLFYQQHISEFPVPTVDWDLVSTRESRPEAVREALALPVDISYLHNGDEYRTDSVTLYSALNSLSDAAEFYGACALSPDPLLPQYHGAMCDADLQAERAYLLHHNLPMLGAIGGPVSGMFSAQMDSVTAAVVTLFWLSIGLAVACTLLFVLLCVLFLGSVQGAAAAQTGIFTHFLAVPASVVRPIIDGQFGLRSREPNRPSSASHKVGGHNSVVASSPRIGRGSFSAEPSGTSLGPFSSGPHRLRLAHDAGDGLIPPLSDRRGSMSVSFAASAHSDHSDDGRSVASAASLVSDHASILSDPSDQASDPSEAPDQAVPMPPEVSAPQHSARNRHASFSTTPLSALKAADPLSLSPTGRRGPTLPSPDELISPYTRDAADLASTSVPHAMQAEPVSTRSNSAVAPASASAVDTALASRLRGVRRQVVVWTVVVLLAFISIALLGVTNVRHQQTITSSIYVSYQRLIATRSVAAYALRTASASPAEQATEQAALAENAEYLLLKHQETLDAVDMPEFPVIREMHYGTGCLRRVAGACDHLTDPTDVAYGHVALALSGLDRLVNEIVLAARALASSELPADPAETVANNVYYQTIVAVEPSDAYDGSLGVSKVLRTYLAEAVASGITQQLLGALLIILVVIASFFLFFSQQTKHLTSQRTQMAMLLQCVPTHVLTACAELRMAAGELAGVSLEEDF